MGWIKRNLFFTIGGILALGLLGAAGYYIYSGWSRNAADFAKLNEIVGTIQNLNQKKPSPGNDTIDNTRIARDQEQEVLAWIKQARNYFQPVPSIPPKGSISSETYAGALRRTIDQLQRDADAAAVTLPPNYDFSFSAQRPLVRFAPGSLDPLAEQLGEVKAISEILFSTRINALDGIQRVRVSDDDLSGPQSDYLNEQSVTNGLAVVTPYVVTFRSFTPELSRVLAAFAASSNTFIIKSINVQPAGAMDNTAGVPGYPPPGMQPGMPPGLQAGRVPNQYQYNQYNPQMGMPGTQPVVNRGGLQVVLKEQLLRITMEVDLLKLLPPS